MRRTLAYAVTIAVLLLGLLAWQRFAAPATSVATDQPAPPAALPGQRLQGRATVFDADTLGVQGRRLRLEGIDAPEFTQTCGPKDRKWACGKDAIVALKAQLDGRAIDCRIVGIDRYQRGLARCSIAGEDLNRWLVRNGWAVTFGDDYVMDEIAAEHERLGLWRDGFERPSQWRRTHPRQQ